MTTINKITTKHGYIMVQSNIGNEISIVEIGNNETINIGLDRSELINLRTAIENALRNVPIPVKKQRH